MKPARDASDWEWQAYLDEKNRYGLSGYCPIHRRQVIDGDCYGCEHENELPKDEE